MTDQTIPAGLTRDQAQAVREWAERARGAEIQDETVAHAARVLLAVLPPRPTLADMTDEERSACKWMQADVKDRSVRYVIANPCDAEGDAALTSAYGEIEWIFPEYVTPRPDLPRIEWPGNEKPAPFPALPHGWRLADHPDHGRVIVTSAEPDEEGDVAIAVPVPTNIDRARLEWCRPDELTYIDREAEDANMAEVGDVIESADDPRIDALPVGSILLDRDEEATIKGRGEWTGAGHIPIPSEGTELGPWTVLHIPKEADQ